MTIQMYLSMMWNSSAHMRQKSMPMAFVTAILMYPTFVQELWHYHTFNTGALANAAQVFAAWMGMALNVQSAKSVLFSNDIWSNPVFMWIAGIVIVACTPQNILGSVVTTLTFLSAILMYESGLQALQYINGLLKKIDDAYLIRTLKEMRMMPYPLVAGGIVIALYIALRTGHLL